MTLIDFIKNKVMSLLGIQRLQENPNDDRFTFISHDEEIKMAEVKANKVWFVGNGDELLNYYSQKQAVGFNDNPIYNRNKRNYFWSLSSQECDIKRIHSGIPNAIVTTLSNVIGMPKIVEPTGIWEKIAEENDFANKLTQQARPLTMACGYGAFKINIDKKYSDYPTIEYYDAENVEYIYKSGILIGVLFKSYYKDKNNKNYVLIESRYKANKNSYIEYNLFKLEKANEIKQVPLDTLDVLKGLSSEIQEIKGLNQPLAVPVRYLFDPQNVKYGKSIYAGKLDFFDMLDEIWSQASQTNRVSTPVEYYNPDVIDRNANGFVSVPRVYNRQFIQKAGIPDGDGNMSNDIITTQPELNFEKYGGLARDVLDNILTGILSPATMGIEVAKKDNAEAQREKEKVTLMTRDNIIANETIVCKILVKLCLYLYEYMNSGQMTLQDYDISVRYDEFANPSFETQIQILGSAWANGEISTAKYVDLLWGDALSDEEKLSEVEWLDNNRKQDNFDINDLAMGEDTNGENVSRNEGIEPQVGNNEGSMAEGQE